MLVVTPTHPGDIEQALRQAQWIRELGWLSGHDLLLIADTRCPKDQVEALHLEYAASYDHVEVLDFVDHYRKWAESPNEVFATAARYIMRTRAQPFFFLEPDSVPLKPGWLDALWVEYRQCGKPFMGDLVTAATAGINVIDHMSGNGFYPADMFTHAGLALISNEIPWDVSAASQIVPQMHATKLIQHHWKAPPFESWQQVEERIRPEAMVYHASKDGSLITLLREHRMMDLDAGKTVDDGPMANIEQNADENASHRAAGSGVLASQETDGNSIVCDIFVKSWPNDYEWAAYLMRSIDKFCSGFREVVIIAPNDKCPVPNYPHRLVVEPEAEGIDGYLHQGAVKACAHRYTDATYICHVDSDCLFIKPVTPETFFRDGKPYWLFSPYSKIEAPWQPYTEKFIGHPVENEWMRQMPMFVRRYVHVELEQFCLATHGCSVEEYVMKQPYREWSEFNALGAIAWDKFHDRIAWINCHNGTT